MVYLLKKINDTECRLSNIGMFMLEDLNKNCVNFKPNYDETTEEPITLPSRFPFLLCGNNSGIAVGMSSDLVSHNYTEVAEAIKFYLKNPNCTILDLMNYIKGPDFPTGGQIINGEDLYNIYSSGHGSLKMRAHYDIVKKGAKTLIIFHDIPYGVEIDSGVKAPLKQLVLEEGYEVFEDIDVKKAGPRNFDITVTLSKNADVANCLNILFTKTRLGGTVKVNNTVIVNGEPKVLNLKQLIEHWVNYRSGIIQHIAQNDYKKTQHKLTVTIGLQKCMSDIDKLISLIRESNSRADAKAKLIAEFTLNDEQAEAVLDMKLSRLSRLDLQELDEDEKKYQDEVLALSNIISDEQIRYEIIAKDLDEMKKIIGKDERLTEIVYSRPIEGVENADQPVIRKEWLVYSDGVVAADQLIAIGGNKAVQDNLKGIVFAYNKEDILGYNQIGELVPLDKIKSEIIGAFELKKNKNKIVSVTKNGNIKVSNASEYKFNKIEKVMKLKEDDELVAVASCNDSDFIILYDGAEHLLKLAVSELPVASKLTVGVKSGFANISSAFIAADTDVILCCTSDNKGKLTPVKDFTIDSRGNKGQLLAEKTRFIREFDGAREDIYIVPKIGKPFIVNRSKISIKSRTAQGASISNKLIGNII